MVLGLEIVVITLIAVGALIMAGMEAKMRREVEMIRASRADYGWPPAPASNDQDSAQTEIAA